MQESVALNIAKQFGKGIVNAVNPKFYYHSYKDTLTNDMMFGKHNPAEYELYANLTGMGISSGTAQGVLYINPLLSKFHHHDNT
jgi:hypothetical protein